MGGPYGTKKIDINTGVDTGAQTDADKVKTIMGLLLQNVQPEPKTELLATPQPPDMGRTLLTNLGG